jgi:type IV secretory pathway TraG/TraD family ATPase VirD4
MLDEFPALGRLDFFESALAFMAGYRIKAFLIAQSLNQIEKAYGPNNAILDNCHVRVTYNALDERTAKRISDLLGQATLLKRQRSFSGGISWLAKVSHSEQEHARPLLMPDEILRLPYDEALLMIGGLPPYRAKKLMYYLDPRFRDRAWLKPPASARSRAAELPTGPRVNDWPKAPAVAGERADPSGARPPFLVDQGAPQSPALSSPAKAGLAGCPSTPTSSFSDTWSEAFGKEQDDVSSARAPQAKEGIPREDPVDDDQPGRGGSLPL